MYCIYKITDLRNDEIVYVGKTKDFNKRRSFHFTQSKTPIQRYMLDEGREYFEMTKIQDNIETNEKAVKIEDQFIVDLAPIMNIRRSGHIEKDDPKEYNREYHKSEKYNEYRKSEKRREYNREYEKTEKRREYMKGYQKSEKYKEYIKEYEKSEKRKEYKREYNRQYRLKKNQEKQQQST